jgi:glycerol-1-phosphate dehydrogenase [NAD(P)+]
METIHDVQEYLRRDSAGLANTILVCPYCGREHKLPFSSVHLGSGVVGHVPTIAEQILGHKSTAPWVIYDRAIEEIIQAAVILPLARTGMNVRLAGVGRPGLLLDSDEAAFTEVVAQVDPQADLLIGAGSGVISDLTKAVATHLDKPFILCGTAPSMNSYTSITATITENDIKTSKWYNPANAVVLDVDILSKAPKAMIYAGVGDLVARASCNADWMLQSRVKQVYFCPLPYQLTAENERKYLAAASAIGRADPPAIQTLAEAILISGYSMTMLNGETSPSSGGEHVISHFWDFMVHLRGDAKNFHGTQVGIATLMMLALYDHVRRLDPGKIDPVKLARKRLSLEQIEGENRTHFGEKAESFNQAAHMKYMPELQYIGHIRSLTKDWQKLWEILDPYIAPLESIRQPLLALGAPTTLAEIHRSRADGVEALLFGGRYRTRYTLLDLAWELGVFPDAAEEVLQHAGVLQ